MDNIEKARELINKHLYLQGGDGLGITNGYVYRAVLDAVVEALNTPVVNGSWVYVNQETPPTDIELLAKAPDGTIHLTSWRPAYDIFCCQCKSESAFDWQWKLV